MHHLQNAAEKTVNALKENLAWSPLFIRIFLARTIFSTTPCIVIPTKFIQKTLIKLNFLCIYNK
jgi:hypothetical protein